MFTKGKIDVSDSLVFSLKKSLSIKCGALEYVYNPPQIISQIIQKQTKSKRIIIQLLPVIYKKNTRNDYKYITIYFDFPHTAKQNSIIFQETKPLDNKS